MIRDFELEAWFSKWEFSARYHLTASDIESIEIGKLLSLASGEDRRAFEHLRLGYIETWGTPELRAEIAGTYESAQPEDILCFAGAEEGLFTAMKVLLDRNAHAIVTVPNYQSAETIPLGLCEVTGIPLLADRNWDIDLQQVREAIRPQTKLISINFPHNPTGAVLDQSTYSELIALCRRHGLWLFSDEVYRMTERDPSLRLPQVGDVYEKGLSLNVMSKAYGLPGLRIGWIMTRNRTLLQKMERFKHYLSICNSSPSERLAIIALKARKKILAENRTLLAENLAHLFDFFAEFEDLFDWYTPGGGCVLFPRYQGRGNTEDFCRSLVEEAGILLLPPSVFRSELLPTPRDRFRIGFGRKNIQAGLDAFRNHLLKKGHR